ncbi:MAG: bacteriocin fulvocin C-related protein [Bacteroidales bacterium]|nr:bacteriocin fulvocin C-related protein [Bacteroidales bacterium]
MKTIISILVASATALLLFSCNKQQIFSCDPVVNEWAIENVPQYENESREQIVLLPLRQQQAIYVGLSGERKVSLWQEKALIESENLSDDEGKTEYLEFFRSLKSYHYDTIKGQKEIEKKAKELDTILRSQYGWDDYKIFYLASIWMTQDEYLESLAKDNYFNVKSGIIGDLTPTCNCIYSAGCEAGYICYKDNQRPCKRVKMCGIAGNSNCTGICE